MSSLEVFCSHAVAELLPQRCSVKKEERGVKHTVLNFIYFSTNSGLDAFEKFHANAQEEIKLKILIQSFKNLSLFSSTYYTIYFS